MPTLYLIDGHGQFFRAYHAIRTGMTSPVTKEPTNMTFGFTGIMLKLLRDYRPDYLAVVIDVAGDRETFRSQLYPEYKANRKETPEDFHPQVERCLQVLRELRVPVIGEPEVEADDVIATLIGTLRREQPELKIRIVSRDKDLAQLVDDHVELLDIYKDAPVTAESLFDVPGVQPKHVADILALMGDTVDNVPGIPGVGPKTAAQLILQYGSLDGLLASLDQLKGKRRESIEAGRDILTLSRQLVELKRDVPLRFNLDDARVDPARLPVDQLLSTFRELGFNRYQDDIRKLAAGAGAAMGAGSGPGAASPGTTASRSAKTDGPADTLFGAAPITPSPSATEPRRGRYHAVTSPAALDTLIADLRRAGEFAIDTETTGLDTVTADLCGISISLAPGTGVYIPARSPDAALHLDAATILDRLRPVLEDPSIRKVGHNLKFDLNILRRHGVRMAGAVFDTMIASYVIDATRSSHKMDVLALALLGYHCIPITDLIGAGRQQRSFDTAPLDQATPYAAEDADVTLRLREVMAPQLKAMGLLRLFDEVEMPLVEVLAELEYNGIAVDPVELDRQRAILEKRVAALRRQMAEAAPYPFNPDSPKQLAALLFNKPEAEPPGLGLKPIKRTRTGPSTDQEVLEKLAADPAIASPIPRLIVEHRQLSKLVSTYLVALKEAINPRTGRVHASFHQTVAATGRISSSDPNLQNIPIRTEVGREIRRAFIAAPGSVLISADYSQIELRLLAHLSDDPALIEAFRRGLDIHTAVAAEVFGVPPDAVTATQRSSAKMVNFGIVYGITAFGLARRLQMAGAETTNDQAARIIADYKARYSRIAEFLDRCVAHAERQGSVETILGRRRAIPQIHMRDPQHRALGERLAINSVVQGSAADLIKVAMIDLHRRLPLEFPAPGPAHESPVKMLLQIHDELVFECPEPLAERAAGLIADRMQHAMTLKVPLVVETAWSRNWIDAK
jgi:DNA polymerase-1